MYNLNYHLYLYIYLRSEGLQEASQTIDRMVYFLKVFVGRWKVGSGKSVVVAIELFFS